MNKKILIVSAVFPPEPVVSSIISYDIALFLSKSNEVTVISPYPTRPFGSDYKNEKIKCPFKHYILPSKTSPKSRILGRILESISFGYHVRKFVKNNNYQFDVIYANVWPIFSQYIITKLNKRIPIVLHIQDIYPESLITKQLIIIRFFLKLLILPIDRIILKNTSKIVAISSSMITYLSSTRKINKSNFVLVRNWQNMDAFTCNNTLNINYSESSELTYTYLGTINESCNLHTVIEAFNNVKIPFAKFKIYGNGDKKKELMALVNSLNNKDISFHSTDNIDIAEVQYKSDYLILPLKKGISYTATPSKMTSYLYSQKPIIAFVDKFSDVDLCITNAKCGLVAKPDSIESIEETFLFSSRLSVKERESMGRNSLKLALNEFSKDSNLKKLTDVILSINNTQNE